MNRLADSMPIRASLLDRLQDHSSDHSVRAGHQNLKDLIQSVHEHLEALLNTRWRAVGGGDGQDELKRSLINYGIPDFAATSVASPEGQMRFQNLVTEAIRLHEPRFLDVKVEIIETDDARRSLHFRIQGELHAQPEPAHVAFDSMLDPTDQRIRVNTFDHV
jgi:type VI secretion system protein ImpF